MTDLQRNIIGLRDLQYTYKKIAEELGCNADYVKDVCGKYRKGFIIERKKKEKPIVDKSKICEYCGNVFEASRKTTRFCSNECRNKAYNEKRVYKSQAVRQERFCKTCGVKFVSRNDKHIYCTRQCGKKYRGIGRRYTSSRDERLKEAVEYNKAVNLHTLIKRDNNKCMICGCDCDLYDYEVTSSGAMMIGNTYPTIDHIYPCSKGGSHTWENVQLACMRCNREKRDNIE